jgi:hypothetical protein
MESAMKRLNAVGIFLLLSICLSSSKVAMADVYHAPYPHELGKLCAIYAQRYGISPDDRAGCELVRNNEDAAIRRMFTLRTKNPSGYCEARADFVDALAIQAWVLLDPERRMYLVRSAPVGKAASQAQLEALVYAKAENFGLVVKNALGDGSFTSVICRQTLTPKGFIFHQEVNPSVEADIQALAEFFGRTSTPPAMPTVGDLEVARQKFNK